MVEHSTARAQQGRRLALFCRARARTAPAVLCGTWFAARYKPAPTEDLASARFAGCPCCAPAAAPRTPRLTLRGRAVAGCAVSSDLCRRLPAAEPRHHCRLRFHLPAVRALQAARRHHQLSDLFASLGQFENGPAQAATDRSTSAPRPAIGTNDFVSGHLDPFAEQSSDCRPTRGKLRRIGVGNPDAVGVALLRGKQALSEGGPVG